MSQSNLENAIIARLEKASDKGDRVVSCCPYHNERSPSFSFYRNGGFQCFGCGKRGSILELARHLGLEGIQPGRQAPHSSLNRRVVYEYHDDSDNLVARVTRIEGDEGKKFLQETKNPETGRWELKRHYPLPLFKLPLLRDAEDGSIVWVVEGEKCVEAITSIGGVATTTAGGSKAFRSADLTGLHYLKKKRVIIIPDNDDPGEAYAECWRVECRKRRIDACVVRLPRARSSKYDVFDHLAEGGTLQELIDIANVAASQSREAMRLSTTLYEAAGRLQGGAKEAEVKREILRLVGASESVTEGAESFSSYQAKLRLAEKKKSGELDERFHFGLPSVDRITHGIVKGSLVILGGSPGRGKTGLSGQLAEHFAQHYGAVHITSAEMTEVELQGRAAVRYFQRPLEHVSYEDILEWAERYREEPIEIHPRSVTLDWLEANLRLWAAMQDKPIFAVVDYLQILDRPANQDDQTFIAQATRRLKKLAMDLQIIIVLLSQLSRNGQDGEAPDMRCFMGSSAIESNADVAMVLWADNKLHVLKNRNGETGATPINFDKARMTFSCVEGILSEGERWIEF